MNAPHHRHLAHLAPLRNQPILFLTACTWRRRPLLACPRAHEILLNLWCQSATHNGWTVGRYVIMPDHVHLFARAHFQADALATWMQAWKSISSRRLSVALVVDPPIWQEDYFDRYLRGAENYQQKWQYVVDNPVRKKLVLEADAWPYAGCVTPLE